MSDISWEAEAYTQRQRAELQLVERIADLEAQLATMTAERDSERQWAKDYHDEWQRALADGMATGVRLAEMREAAEKAMDTACREQAEYERMAQQLALADELASRYLLAYRWAEASRIHSEFIEQLGNHQLRDLSLRWPDVVRRGKNLADNVAEARTAYLAAGESQVRQ